VQLQLCVSLLGLDEHQLEGNPRTIDVPTRASGNYTEKPFFFSGPFSFIVFVPADQDERQSLHAEICGCVLQRLFFVLVQVPQKLGRPGYEMLHRQDTEECAHRCIFAVIMRCDEI
jgi:hypothetical protein